MSDRQHMIETIRMWWGDPRGASDIADAIIDGGRWVPRAALDAALDENRTLREQIEAQGETLAATCREANDAIEDAQDEIEKLISINGTHRAAIDLVRDLHGKVDAAEPWCGHCIGGEGGFVDWPCDTIRRLDDALGGGE